MVARLATVPPVACSAALALCFVLGCSGAAADAGLFGAAPDGGAVEDDGATSVPAAVDDPGSDGEDGGPSDAATQRGAEGGAPVVAEDAGLEGGSGAEPTAACLALYPEYFRSTTTIVEVPYGVGEVKYVATDTTRSPAGQSGVGVRLALCRPGINPALVLVTTTPDTTAPFTWVFGPTTPLPGVTQAALVHGAAFDKVWASVTFVH